MKLLSWLGLLLLVLPLHLRAFTDSELARIQSGFVQRRDAGLRAIDLDHFKPAPKNAPLKPGRPPYVRAYGYSLSSFVLTALWRDEHVSEANQRLIELCQYFSANRDVRNDYDNFYWWTNQLVRAIQFFGQNGSIASGRLNAQAEAAADNMMWLWVKEWSVITESETYPDHWFIKNSENHHLAEVVACWSFCDLLRQVPAYRGRKLDDGHSVEEHFAAWNGFAKSYFTERVKHGLFVETASSYNSAALKGVYDMYDFASDPELKRRARMFLDLYWATWAQEQLDGVRGGGRARTYPTWSTHGEDVYRRLTWFLLGIGRKVVPDQPDEVGLLTTTYRIPLIDIDLALDRRGRGIYEIKQWPLGLAVPGHSDNPGKGYWQKTDGGGIYRYSYCTPEFILGTLMYEARPQADWTLISSQNRWQGVIFDGEINARIYPVPQPIPPERAIFNSWWSVQSKGTLITQRLAGDPNLGPMRVWFSRTGGLDKRVELGGWIFIRTANAYAAVRAVKGATRWEEGLGTGGGAGDWLVCEDAATPVILEVVRAADYDGFAEFEGKLTGQTIDGTDGVLRYTSSYGDRFTFDAAGHHPPTINGQEPPYRPQASFDSPFISSPWNSGVVEIKKGDRRLTLNFNP